MPKNITVPFILPRTGDQWLACIIALFPVALVLGSVPFELVIGLVGLLWLMQAVFSQLPFLRRIVQQPTFWPLMIWMIGILLSRVTNGFSSSGFIHDFSYIRYLFFFLAIVDVSQRLDLDRYLFAGVAAGVVWTSTNILSASAFGVDFIGDPLSFYTEKLHEGERIAAFSSYIFPFFVLRMLSGKDLRRLERTALWVLIVLAGALLFITKIRTAWLAAGIGLLGGLALTLRGRYRWGIVGGVALGMVIAGLVMYCSGYQTSMGSMYDRYWIWQRSFTLWKEHPILGVGVSNFSDSIYRLAASTDFKPYIAPDGMPYDVRYASHSHDLFLHLLSCTGIWGFIAFFWLLAAATARWLQNSSALRIGLGACPFVLVGNAMTGWTVYDSFYGSIVIFFLAWLAAGPPPAQGEKGA
jgi:O-antigen ligase